MTASPDDLAEGIFEMVRTGAGVLNLSISLAQPSTRSWPALRIVLDYAAAQGCLVVAAAGNQGTLGSSQLTRHPWVLPVAACDASGKPLPVTNLGQSVGTHGASALGEDVVSLASNGGYTVGGAGTSTATAIVTGATALLWSSTPAAPPARVRRAVTRADWKSRHSIMPPVLDAEAALLELLAD